jgi:biopolymer transport protein ExbD
VSSRRKKRQKDNKKFANTVELNLMPFIDVFSLLTTFLLFSAVFLAIGILEVQIPFLSNAPPPKDRPERSLEVNIELEAANLIVRTSYSAAPKDEKVFEFKPDPEGISEMHQRLIQIRSENPKTDKVTFFVDDDVNYKDMTAVLDAIKLRKEGDPEIPAAPDMSEIDKAELKAFLYPKVIMGSVLLQ